MEAACWYKGNQQCCQRAFPSHHFAPSGCGSAVAPASEVHAYAGGRGRPAWPILVWFAVPTTCFYICTGFCTYSSTPISSPAWVQQAVLGTWADLWATSFFIAYWQVHGSPQITSLMVLQGANTCVRELAKLGECSWGGDCLIGGFAWDSFEELVKLLLHICKEKVVRWFCITKSINALYKSHLFGIRADFSSLLLQCSPRDFFMLAKLEGRTGVGWGWLPEAENLSGLHCFCLTPWNHSTEQLSHTVNLEPCAPSSTKHCLQWICLLFFLQHIKIMLLTGIFYQKEALVYCMSWTQSIIVGSSLLPWFNEAFCKYDQCSS